MEAKSLMPIHFSKESRKEMLVAVRLSLLLLFYSSPISRCRLIYIYKIYNLSYFSNLKYRSLSTLGFYSFYWIILAFAAVMLGSRYYKAEGFFSQSNREVKRGSCLRLALICCCVIAVVRTFSGLSSLGFISLKCFRFI